MKEDWEKCLISPVGFKGFGLDEPKLKLESKLVVDGK